jgi:hypothetical protein
LPPDDGRMTETRRGVDGPLIAERIYQERFIYRISLDMLKGTILSGRESSRGFLHP